MRSTPIVPLLLVVALSSGCSMSENRDARATSSSGSGDKRLEETWGPGELATLLTGTLSSQDRNLWVNVPLASWYVREQDRKGTALLGGALAYDMVTVERTEDGRPENQKLTSVGFLGIAGNLEERRLDGTRGYEKRHWFFPFYRYRNVNGKRTVYPLFIFPIALTDDPNTGPAYDPIALARTSGAPIDPPSVKPVDRPIGTSRLIDPAPAMAQDEPLQPGPDHADEGDGRTPIRRTDDGTASGRWGTEPASSRRGDPGSVTGRVTGTSDTPPAKKAADPPKPAETKPPVRTYTVKSGDTLFSIAKEIYGRGDDWKRIFDANRDRLSAPDRLPHGTILRIPQ